MMSSNVEDIHRLVFALIDNYEMDVVRRKNIEEGREIDDNGPEKPTITTKSAKKGKE